MALSRISITLPRDVLVAADRRARALDRSRSWLIVEALRAYLATPARSASAGIREPDAPVYAAREVADARRQHLAADLKRPPAERLRRAEELARLARQVRPRRGRRQQVIGFDSYEDFYEWKKARLAGGDPARQRRAGVRGAQSVRGEVPRDRRRGVHPARLRAHDGGRGHPDRAHAD